MQNINLSDYFDALDRLSKNKPLVVPLGTKISNDSVSLEAGRRKGSIKKSRPMFAELISAIKAKALSPSATIDVKPPSSRKLEPNGYRELYESQLAARGAVLLQLQHQIEVNRTLKDSSDLQAQEISKLKLHIAQLKSELGAVRKFEPFIVR